MRGPTRPGWLVAILLALSLIAPFSSPASAAQTDAAQTTDSTSAVTPTETDDSTQPTDSEETSAAAQLPAHDQGKAPCTEHG
jgi:hypothetical protein